MALEKRLIDGDVLEPDNAFLALDFQYAVNQQKRITMWKKAHDIHNAVNEALLRIGDCHRISHTSPSNSISALAGAHQACLFSLCNMWARLQTTVRLL
jgi:Tfp pilus assembly protein PilX